MKLLVSEIAQTEELWKATGKNAADRVTITRRLAETYVELENAAFRDKTESEIKKDTANADKAKKTMEAADNLYGVTMEEPGVSKLISVRLDDAERFKTRGVVSAESASSA